MNVFEKINPDDVELRVGPLFLSTMAEKKQDPRYKGVGEKIWTFFQEKKQNPFKRLSGDLPTSGVFTEYVPGIQHYKLGLNLRLWWRVSGNKPTYIDLLAVYNHEETGTGEPPKSNIQKQAAAKLQKEITNLKVVPTNTKFE